MAQAVHGAIEWAAIGDEDFHQWHKDSNHICVLSASPDQLQSIWREARNQDISWERFCEPDYDNRFTCLVLEPGDKARKLTSQLPLALRGL